jgi:hypothetical protein
MTISSAMANEAVAAGDGALQMCNGIESPRDRPAGNSSEERELERDCPEWQQLLLMATLNTETKY